MKKILINAYLAYNFGDDLFLKIIFERYPDVIFTISKAGKKYKQLFKKYKNVRVENTLIHRAFRKLNIKQEDKSFNYDALVYIGGSIFMQFEEWKNQFKEREKLMESFFNAGKSVFVVGANFGPFQDIHFADLYREKFIKCTDVCFRDKYSYNLFKDLNNVRVASDIVFQLKSGDTTKIKNSIGISVISLEGRKELEKYQKIYNLKIKEIIEKCIQNGKVIKLFSFCDEQGDMSAIKSIIDIIDEKYHKNISTVNYCGNIDEFLREFSSVENIIGTRFHACILSQVFNQGLYPIIYSDKTYNALEDMELEKEYTYIKGLHNLDTNYVIDVISDNKLKSKKVYLDSENQFKVLDEYINDN